MRRSATILAILSLMLLVTPIAAAGGGGCHAPEGVVAKARGATISYAKACASPSILEVEPGTTVTWKNPAEGLEHTVTAGVPNSPWSHQTLASGRSFSVRFDKPGLYPYYCMLHVYMGGIVEVGGGSTPELSDTSLAAAETSEPPSSDGAMWIAIAAALGLFGGIGITALARRKA